MKPSIFKSRKFWLAILDAVIVIAAVVIGKFVPEWADFSAQIAAPITVVLTAVIIGIAVEDAAFIKSQG